jgi:hypothetical protein
MNQDDLVIAALQQSSAKLRAVAFVKQRIPPSLLNKLWCQDGNRP